MKIAIIDDDSLWLKEEQEILSAFLEKEGQNPEFFSFTSCEEILKDENSQYDLAFVDIEMEGENGISFARKLNVVQKRCQLIYVTNYLNYASDVYETEHIYFVLKEQFQERLPIIFEKIKKNMSMGSSQIRLSVIHGDYVCLWAEEILYFERHLRKTIVHTVTGEYEVFDKLEELLGNLPKPLFIRCHNSYLISLGHVRKMTQTEFQLDNGFEVPISRRYYSGVKKQFLEWSGLQM